MMFNVQKGLENVGKLGDDTFTVKYITAPGNLNTPIWKHLHRLGTVGVVVGKGDLVVECCRFQFPLKPPVVVSAASSHCIRTEILKYCTKSFDINLLHKP